METSNLGQPAERSTRILGAIIASVCVMGLVGMLWLHGESPNLQPGAYESAGATTPVAGQAAFLHAPVTDRSVPSADQVFAQRRTASDEDATAAPTF